MAKQDNQPFNHFTIKLMGNANDLSEIVSDLGAEYYIESGGNATAGKKIQVPKDLKLQTSLKRKLKMTEEILPKRVILVVPKDSPVPASTTLNDVMNIANEENNDKPKVGNSKNYQFSDKTENATTSLKTQSPQKLFKLANKKTMVFSNKIRTVSINTNKFNLPVVKASENVLLEKLTKEENSTKEKTQDEVNELNLPAAEASENVLLKKSTKEENSTKEETQNKALNIKSNLISKSDQDESNNVEPANLELMNNLGLTYCKNGTNSKTSKNEKKITVSENDIDAYAKSNIQPTSNPLRERGVGATASRASERLKRMKKRKLLTMKKKSKVVTSVINPQIPKRKRGRPKKPVVSAFEMVEQRSRKIRETLSQEIGIPIPEFPTDDFSIENKKMAKCSTSSKNVTKSKILKSVQSSDNVENFSEAVSKDMRQPDPNRRKSLRILKRKKLSSNHTDEDNHAKDNEDDNDKHNNDDDNYDNIDTDNNDNKDSIDAHNIDNDNDDKDSNDADDIKNINDNEDSIDADNIDYQNGNEDSIDVDDDDNHYDITNIINEDNKKKDNENDVQTLEINTSITPKPQVHKYIISNIPSNSGQASSSDISFIEFVEPVTSRSPSSVIFQGLKIKKNEAPSINNDIKDPAVQETKMYIPKKPPIKIDNLSSLNPLTDCNTPRGSFSSTSSDTKSEKDDITIFVSTPKSSQIKIINGVKCSLRAPDPNILHNDELKDKINALLKNPTSVNVKRTIASPERIVQKKLVSASEVSESLVSTTTFESNQASKQDCQLCDKLQTKINELSKIIKKLKQQIHQRQYRNVQKDSLNCAQRNKRTMSEEQKISDMMINTLEERNRSLYNEIRNEKLNSAKLRVNISHRDNRIKDLTAKLAGVTKLLKKVGENAYHVQQQLKSTEQGNIDRYSATSVDCGKKVQKKMLHHT